MISTMLRQIFGVARSYRQPDLETGLQARDEKLQLEFADDSWPKEYHRRSIVKKIKSPTPNEYSYRVNLTELQQLYLRQLQRRLLKHAVDLRHGAAEPPGWADDLKQYGTTDNLSPLHSRILFDLTLKYNTIQYNLVY